jgi:hypothetical protein
MADTPDNDSTPDLPDPEAFKEYYERREAEQAARHQQDIAALKGEFFEDVQANKKIAVRVDKILTESSEDIAQAMVETAMHCEDPRVRFQAQRYVLDRVLTNKDGDTAVTPFQDVIDRLTKRAPAREDAE